uniref:Protein kinase domain-containing protein n=2 Tax=Aegilops tauschii subsp. strangulata TaxID=200361 RepID=A0A453DKA9_AEGTS
MPHEYLFGNVVSNKLDIFSLGVVMIKIIAGPSGHTRHAEMHYQEFFDLVRKISLRLDKNTMFIMIWCTCVCCNSNLYLDHIGSRKLEKKVERNMEFSRATRSTMPASENMH